MAALCICACGLSVYYVLEPPYNATVRDEDLSADEHYFDFTTDDSSNTNVLVFKGTMVYYKIYNNSSKLSTQVTSIKSANDEYSEDGYNKLVSYNYKPMTLDTGSLISDQGYDANVTIRLITEGYGDSIYTKGIKVGTNDSWGYAYRSNGDEFTSVTETLMEGLDEGDDNSGNYDIYKSDEDDDDSSSDGWYIAAFAVSYGMAADFSDTYYSELAYLGYLYLKYDDYIED